MTGLCQYFLGVDGGGTKTEFVCIDGAGAVLARTTTGTTYHIEVGLAETRRRLESGIAAVLAEAGIPRDAIEYAFVGLPAYGEDGAIDPLLDAACAEMLASDRFACGNDMICGWAGSLGGADGINIVAGTGSIGYGEHEDRAARAGGWGEVFGDEGSAYWIAIRGLALFSRMSDGRRRRGPLYDYMRTAIGIADDLDLCAKVMGPAAMGRSEIAGLAKIVSDAAAAGDEAAQAILIEAAHELVDLAIALRSTLCFEPHQRVPLSWSGGVLVNAPIVRAAFEERLVGSGLFQPVRPLHAPGYGAALYARRLAGQLAVPSLTRCEL